MHSPDDKPPTDPIVNRLRRANGHLNHIIGMMEDGKSPKAIAQQLQGVEQAIRQAKQVFIREEMDQGIEDLLGPVPNDQREAIEELKDLAKYL